MVIGVLTLELRLPNALTLKDKRSHLRPLLEGLRRRWNVTATETGNRDLWQRATITVATVNTEQAEAHATLEAVTRHVDHEHSMELLDYSIEFL